MLSTKARLSLALANFLVGTVLFAVVATLTAALLPPLGKGVARFLPMLLGSTVSYPLILGIRASGNLFLVRWVTIFGLPLALLALASATPGTVSPWVRLADLALVIAVVQATRSLRSDIAEESGPRGDKFLIWADLGYGFGTTTGILLWDKGLANVGGFAANVPLSAAPFRIALVFAATLFLVAYVIDVLVYRSRTEGDAPASEFEYDAGDAHAWSKERALAPMIRWAAVVPLTTIAIQATVMRQTDRFDDFFSYMSFDIGTVIAGVVLGLFLTIRVADTPYIPPEYIPIRKRDPETSSWEPITTRRFRILPWLLLSGAAMVIGYTLELIGSRVAAPLTTIAKVGECLAYLVAGVLFEALWLILLGWIGKSARHFSIGKYVSISGTIGSAILALTVSYSLLTYFSGVHPIYVTLAALAMAMALLIAAQRKLLSTNVSP